MFASRFQLFLYIKQIRNKTKKEHVFKIITQTCKLTETHVK